MIWLHRLFNPHCPECEAKDLNPVIEELKIELTSLRYERDRLLKYILDEPHSKNQPNAPEVHTEDEEPIQPKLIPWAVRKNMLEAEDRKKAQLMKMNSDEQAAAIEELEKKLGIIENTTLDLENGNVQSESVKING